MGAICGGERTEEEEQADRELEEKAIYFLCELRDFISNGSYNMDAVRAEIERREALPPLALTVQDPNGKLPEWAVSVARWDRIGATLSKGLEHYYCVTRVLFGDIELTLTDRWEETCGLWKEGAITFVEWKDEVSAPSLYSRTQWRLSEDFGSSNVFTLSLFGRTSSWWRGRRRRSLRRSLLESSSTPCSRQ